MLGSQLESLNWSIIGGKGYPKPSLSRNKLIRLDGGKKWV